MDLIFSGQKGTEVSAISLQPNQEQVFFSKFGQTKNFFDFWSISTNVFFFQKFFSKLN